MITSVFFLFALFCFRFIPTSIFWVVYSLSLNSKSFFPSKSQGWFYQPFIVATVTVSYLVAFLIMAVLPIAVLNYIFRDNSSNSLVPILLFNQESSLAMAGNNSFSTHLFSFLLNSWNYSRKKLLVLKTLVTALQMIALVLVIFGIIEVYNDFNSHLNPDIFDFLFPANGAGMLWGGATLLILTHFYLSFIVPTPNLIQWKKRLEISSDIPSFLRKFVLSRSLLHPYFFLTPGGRRLIKKNPLPEKKLSLLLEKAYIENRDAIPLEWVKRISRIKDWVL